MHAPAQGIEVPIATPLTSGAVATSMRVSPRRSIDRTRPTSVTMPVNMARNLGPSAVGFQHIRAERQRAAALVARRPARRRDPERIDRGETVTVEQIRRPVPANGRAHVCTHVTNDKIL